MYIQFTNCDSTGASTTKRRCVTIDGERYEIDVASTGTAQVPEDLGTLLVSSDDDIEEYSGDDDPAEILDGSSLVEIDNQGAPNDGVPDLEDEDEDVPDVVDDQGADPTVDEEADE